MADPRQGAFRGATGDLRYYKDDNLELRVIAVEGRFTASGVNLGELYDLIVETLKGKATKERIEELIDREVQRLKSIQVEETDHHWKIQFSTKDDYSWYGYDFNIYKKRLAHEETS